jgi:hypothetical protein
MITTSANGIPRRSFITNVALGSVGASLAAAGSAGAQGRGAIRGRAAASSTGTQGSGGITAGDAAILRFLAAAELLEQDLWQQYAELATNNQPFNNALANIDSDMVSYVVQNSNDEFAHQAFLNDFLISQNLEPADLDAFRNLPSSQATGAQQIGRLTSLMHLNVDTSWYLRYRSSQNPDFGAKFGQVETIMDRPGIPLRNDYTANQIQAIANTAAFHFGMIEQGGTGLYPVMSLKATSLTTLGIVTSIGPTEAMHFMLWNEKAGGVPAVDSGDGLVFTAPPQPAKIFPTPCTFLSKDLPLNAVVRPTSSALNGPIAVVKFLKQTGLFFGQNNDFMTALNKLAAAAEAAQRQSP